MLVFCLELFVMILLGLYITDLELHCSDLQKKLEAKDEELQIQTSQLETLSIKIEDTEDQLKVKQRLVANYLKL